MLKKLFIPLFLALFLITNCSRSKPGAKLQKPVLLVSIAPYQFLTKEIAGSDFEVKTIVPNASNPHSYEPTCRQVAEMSQGTVWFKIGEPFEAKILPILESQNRNLVVKDLRDGIELIEEGPALGCKHCSMDHCDRHIWLSPKLALKQAKAIFETLSLKFPESKETFEKNFNSLSQKMLALDIEIQEILKPVVHRTLLVSHPAFGYFCKEYNLDQLSVEYEGKDPRPKHLESILNQAITQSLEVALALPQYNNKGAQLIAEKLHLPVHFIDPYSAEYFETMKKLAKLIADPYAN